MKLKLDIPIKDLEGKPIPGFDPLNKLLGNALASSQSVDPIKITNIAQTLYNKGEIELDRSDLELLEKEVVNIKTFGDSNPNLAFSCTNLLQAQALKIIKDAQLEEASKSKDK